MVGQDRWASRTGQPCSQNVLSRSDFLHTEVGVSVKAALTVEEKLKDKVSQLDCVTHSLRPALFFNRRICSAAKILRQY